jgi:uncharacterized protein (DUF885 family)
MLTTLTYARDPIMSTPFYSLAARRALTALLLPALLSTPFISFAANGQKGDAAKLAKFAESYFDSRLALFPLMATEDVSDTRFEGELEIEISPEHRARQAVIYRDALKQLEGIDVKALNVSEHISYDLLKYDATQKLEGLKFPKHLLPFHHMDSVPTKLAQWAGGESVQPLKTVKNYENFLKRLERIPAWNEQAIANMKEGLRAGVIMQKPILERTLPQFKALVDGTVEANPLYRPVLNFPKDFSAADKERFTKAYRDALVTRVIPSMKKLHAFLESEYLRKARSSAGWGDLPNGVEWYKHHVREYTTTQLTADEIHALGLKEVARIRGEMEGVKKRVGFEGDLNAFLKGINTRPELTPFKTEEEIIAKLRAIDEKVKPGLAKLFGRMPKAPLEIRGVDPLLRDTASSNYVLPAADGSRPGVFYLAAPEPTKFTTPGMTALLLHEGQPGHHFHMSLQQELDIPRFRRFFWYDAYGEGWALYAESLGQELGVYDDPFAYLGRLQLELHRAIRLVVDTGLHAKGWTRDQTMQYMIDTEGSEPNNARRNTERYMAVPGQALAYKVGELKIIELRKRASQKLGGKFDIRGFHDEVLGAGAMPLSMLEARIDSWIGKSAERVAQQ